MSGLYYADFISFYSPTQLCGGGTTKSNSNELPISVPLSFFRKTFRNLAKNSRIEEVNHQENEYAETSYGSLAWLPAAIGFLAGGFFLRLIDAIVPHLHMTKEIEEAESIHTPREKKLSKTTLLFLAITIHNFPEGLAVGVAFGALASNPSPEAFIGALGLAIGIGLQNIPEGAALSIPIRTDGKSRLNAFYWGSMSAIVEPIGALLGAVAFLSMTAILPYALSFAAGAMIFVVVEELIPDSQTNGNTDVATLGLMVGFVIMMILDVALG